MTFETRSLDKFNDLPGTFEQRIQAVLQVLRPTRLTPESNEYATGAILAYMVKGWEKK